MVRRGRCPPGGRSYESGAPAPFGTSRPGAPPVPPLGTRELLDARVVAVGDARPNIGTGTTTEGGSRLCSSLGGEGAFGGSSATTCRLCWPAGGLHEGRVSQCRAPCVHGPRSPRRLLPRRDRCAARGQATRAVAQALWLRTRRPPLRDPPRGELFGGGPRRGLREARVPGVRHGRSREEARGAWGAAPLSATEDGAHDDHRDPRPRR